MTLRERVRNVFSTLDGKIPTRYTVATVAFFNLLYVYMIRLNINIVIVAMVNYTAIPHTNITIAEECGHPDDDDVMAVETSPQVLKNPIFLFTFVWAACCW